MPHGWLCALYPVPRDYAHPGAGTIRLAVAKLPAADPAKRRGSVFFNPGGPDLSGLFYAKVWEDYVGPSVHRVYDLVTWAPRGVPDSEPALPCEGSEASVRATLQRARAVHSDREIAQQLKFGAELAADCAHDPLTRFVTTMDNVRDLDRLRQAVGDKKLSYVGISYGTVIGAVYANVFPGRYRALVLHGVVDSVTWFEPSFAFSIDEGVQRQRTLNAALQACDAAPSNCPFAPHAPQKYARLLARVREQAASGDPDDFNLLSSLSVLLIRGWRVPGSAGETAGDLQVLYDRIVVGHSPSSRELPPVGREGQPPDTFANPNLRSAGSSVAVFDATICSDAGGMPRTLDAWIKAVHEADRVAPVFGAERVFVRRACPSWSLGARYTGGWDHGRAPILLLNNRWDDATPLAWAQTMTRELGRAHLITISGWGHGRETPCSRRAVDGYLLTGRLPTTSFCEDGRSLFPATPEVFVGYADSVRTSRSHPSPWRGSPSVVFEGCNYFTPSRCPKRGARSVYDAGALRLDNVTSQAMIVTKASVTLGSCTFRPWPGLRVRVPGHKQLILTQTGGKPPCPGGAIEGENFDTSDTNTTGNKCKDDGEIPVFHVTVDGHALTYRDTGQILNTGGKDPGAKGCGSHNETHGWGPIAAGVGVG